MKAGLYALVCHPFTLTIVIWVILVQIVLFRAFGMKPLIGQNMLAVLQQMKGGSHGDPKARNFGTR